MRKREQKLKKIEPELAALQEARAQSAERSKATQAAVSAALNSAAERIEAITRRLNETVRDGGVRDGVKYSGPIIERERRCDVARERAASHYIAWAGL